MIYVGIAITKDKHDCFITDSDGEVSLTTVKDLKPHFKELSLYQLIQPK